MRLPVATWSPIEETTYDEDLLLSIKLGVIVLLVRGRNAWHSTWVEHYLNNATLYSDITSAQSEAEDMRAQGNVFYIIEAPALQLRGAKSNVVICDSHPDNPFGRFNGFKKEVQATRYGKWVDGLFPGISVRDAVAAFKHDSGNWNGRKPDRHSLQVGLLTPGLDISRRRGSLSSLVSESAGVNYKLQWKVLNDGNAYVRKGSHEIERSWNTALSLAEIDSSNFESEAVHRLINYRDHKLGAIPKSIWDKRQQEAKSRQLVELRNARESWLVVADQVAELEESIEYEQYELEEASEDRMHPRDTSVEIRRQRERVEISRLRLTNLEDQLSAAQVKAEELHKEYLSLLSSNLYP